VFCNWGKIKIQDKDDKLERFAELFLRKNKDYFNKNNNLIVGDRLETKNIYMPKSNINYIQEVSINKLKLLKIELDDLLK
jgi:hypothetical protein